MIITKAQQDELLECGRPLIKWLNDNCHPHVTVLVNQTSIELLEGVARIPTDEYLKD